MVLDGPRGKSLDLSRGRPRMVTTEDRDNDELAGEDSSGQEQRQERTARHDPAGVVRDDDYDDGDGNWRLGAFWVGNL